MTAESALIRTEIQLPPCRGRSPLPARIIQGVRGAVWTPVYLAAAHARGMPGINLRYRTALLGLRAARPGSGARLASLYKALFFPLDSTRYFEFDFMWRALKNVRIESYLDISSPRFFPLLLLTGRKNVRATLLNPDARDLQETAAFANALRIADRCRLESSAIQTANLPPNHFDVVTSMSVLEHIPDDADAVARMWSAVKPGGRLLLSVPCAAAAEAQYVNVPAYEFQPEVDGFHFHQYLYDERLLAERVYTITGPPSRCELYGEKRPGVHRRAYEHKWSSATYPFWKEPLFMSREFRRYDSIASLPGEGVIMLEFVK